MSYRQNLITTHLSRCAANTRSRPRPTYHSFTSKNQSFTLEHDVHSDTEMKRRRSGGRSQRDTTSEVTLKILRYLDQNPNAADTVDGILEWWLPKQSIYEEEKVVKRALDELVKRNLILATPSSDARRHYRLNTEYIHEIRRMISDSEHT